MYATALEMIRKFGGSPMAGLSDPTGDEQLVSGELLALVVEDGDRSAYSDDERAAADEAVKRVEAALTESTSLCNSYISKTHVLPLSADAVANSALRRACMDIARYELMVDEDRLTDVAESRYKAAIVWLKDIAAGRASLGEDEQSPSDLSGRVQIKQGSSRHNWDSY